MPTSELNLPKWAHTIRDHQATAVDDIMDAFTRVNHVFLNGPTGTGKTLIAEVVRQRLAALGLADHTLYVCSDKQLQDQFMRDFTYAAMLKGRNNYVTQYGDSRTTAEDCTAQGPDDGCMWCADYTTCPYQQAKAAAIRNPLAVINTSYLLAEANGARPSFSRQPFIICDEADMLEEALLSNIEYVVPQYVARELALEFPIKGAHKPTLIAWLNATAEQAAKHLTSHGHSMEVKVKKRWKYFVQDSIRVAGELQRDVDAPIGEGGDTEDTGRWIRDYDTKTFSLKPVLVGGYGPMKLWRHGRKWLLMSASLISPDEMAASLGLALDWELVDVPMTFPAENRPIILAPVCDVTYKTELPGYERLADAIEAICDLHPGERVLVHTVSYKLTEMMVKLVDVPGRLKLTYRTARERSDVLARFRRTPGSILFAPSMSRGVDLKDDDCRIIVIAKVPFPALGDRRVSARRNLPGGQLWYVVQTVRDVVQMTGRAVRSDTDYCTTYILDGQFTKNVWSRWRMLFPGWWKDAVDKSFNARKLTMRR